MDCVAHSFGQCDRRSNVRKESPSTASSHDAEFGGCKLRFYPREESHVARNDGICTFGILQANLQLKSVSALLIAYAIFKDVSIDMSIRSRDIGFEAILATYALLRERRGGVVDIAQRVARVTDGAGRPSIYFQRAVRYGVLRAARRRCIAAARNIKSGLLTRWRAVVCY